MISTQLHRLQSDPQELQTNNAGNTGGVLESNQTLTDIHNQEAQSLFHQSESLTLDLSLNRFLCLPFLYFSSSGVYSFCLSSVILKGHNKILCLENLTKAKKWNCLQPVAVLQDQLASFNVQRGQKQEAAAGLHITDKREKLAPHNPVNLLQAAGSPRFHVYSFQSVLKN